MTNQTIKVFVSLLLLAVFGLQGSVMGQYSEIDNAIKQEKYSKALDLIKTKLAAEPKADGLHLRRGRTYLLMGETGAAREAFKQAVSYGSRNPINHIGLASALAASKDFAGTKASCDKALELNRKDETDVYVGVADAYLAGQDAKFLGEAETILYKILAKEPENKKALFTLGNMYFVQGVNSLAISNFNEVVKLDDKYLECWMKLGETQMRTKEWQKALDAFKKVEELNPEYAPVKKWLGELEYKRGNLTKATEYMEAYVEATEGDIAAKIRYASFLYLTEQCDKALPIMDAVLKDTNSVVMMRLSAYCYCQKEDATEALSRFETYFKTSKEANIIAADYENRGKAHQLAGNDSLAMLDYDKAVEMDSSKATVYGTAAKKYFDKKDWAKAGATYSKFIEKGEPKFRDYFFWGSSYYYAKDYVNADTAYGTMCAKYPTVHIGFHFRGRVAVQLDTNKEGLARPYYQKSYDILTEKGEEMKPKEKKDLAEACNYLGFSYYSENENCEKAVPFYEKYLELDPEGKNAKGAQQVIDFCKQK